MIKMILFDIGDVLFDESPQHSWLFHTLLLTLRAHEKNVKWDEFNNTRCALAAKGPNPEAAIKESLAFYCCDHAETEQLWLEARSLYDQMRHPRPFGILLDEITAVLEDLQREYRLGIVANQHPPVYGALENYGIASLFETIVISEMVDLYKPDPAIFQYALDAAGISGSEAVFIGDRPDNDVGPAKQVGMKTIRFRRGIHYVYYNPTDPKLTADVTVHSVQQLAETVRGIALGASSDDH